MNETLFFDFLKEKNLTEDFNKFVKTKQSSMKNLEYKLSVMIGDADFWLDMGFVITKDDKAFLQKWSSTFEDDDEVFSTGYENSEKEWNGKMLQNLFQDVDGLLEGSCLGTSYTIEPTDDGPGETEGDFYDRLYNRLENSYEDFDEELLELFKKTSFYEYIKNN